jgi:RNA polymerase sigma factor (TIGR02999 family)
METNPDHEITALLLKWRGGDRAALDQLFPHVYDALHKIAHRQLGREQPGHTLSTTALVHETYLKLVDHVRVDWTDRAHFFAVAARAMRLILVDQARRRDTDKRGGRLRHVSLTDSALSLDEQVDIVLALDEALTELAKLDERMSKVVECRFFGGLTEEETAEALGVTARTVRRDWTKAKGWLLRTLRD